MNLACMLGVKATMWVNLYFLKWFSSYASMNFPQLGVKELILISKGYPHKLFVSDKYLNGKALYVEYVAQSERCHFLKYETGFFFRMEKFSWFWFIRELCAYMYNIYRNINSQFLKKSSCQDWLEFYYDFKSIWGSFAWNHNAAQMAKTLPNKQ